MMIFSKREREEFLASIRLGIDTCTDPKRISTLKVNMQEGAPKWARMFSQVRTQNEKKSKVSLNVDEAIFEVEKLLGKIKFGSINIVICCGVVTDVLEESQFDLWHK